MDIGEDDIDVTTMELDRLIINASISTKYVTESLDYQNRRYQEWEEHYNLIYKRIDEVKQ